jgi:hypothetical protein
MALKLHLAAADEDRRFSPYCRRIKVALAHKDHQVETILALCREGSDCLFRAA